jgi:hypothetical protein
MHTLMKLERIILLLAAFMLAAGYIAWALGGADGLRSLGVWFWLGAFGVLGLPLLAWLVHFVVKRGRD